MFLEDIRAKVGCKGCSKECCVDLEAVYDLLLWVCKDDVILAERSFYRLLEWDHNDVHPTTRQSLYHLTAKSTPGVDRNAVLICFVLTVEDHASLVQHSSFANSCPTCELLKFAQVEATSVL